MTSPGRARAALATALLLLATRAAGAYGGGPSPAQVLGYDAGSARVYYAIRFLDESGDPDQYYFFGLGPSAAAAPVRVPSLEGDPRYRERLLGRLRPLPPRDSSEAAVEVRVLGKDRATKCGEVVTRYRIEMNVTTAGMRTRARTRAYDRPDVVVARVYAIPGRRERVVVLRYQGARGCWEPTERPVLLAPREQVSVSSLEDDR